MRWIKRLLCRIGWHSFGYYDYTFHDGCSQHARCWWCGGVGMIDSQGNLFGVEAPTGQEGAGDDR